MTDRPAASVRRRHLAAALAVGCIVLGGVPAVTPAKPKEGVGNQAEKTEPPGKPDTAPAPAESGGKVTEVAPAPPETNSGSRVSAGDGTTKEKRNNSRATREAEEAAAAATPAPTAAPVVAAATPAAPAAVAPSPTAAPPASARRTRRATRRNRTGRAGRRSAATGPRRTPASTPTAGPVAPVAPRPRAARPATPDPNRAPTPTSTPASEPAPSPVTQIVEVIPRPIRYALAGLAGLALLLAAGFGLVAGRGRRLERERQGLSDDVGLLQSALLPALPETINRTAVSGAYRAADGLAAGGDFFDAFPLGEDSTAIIVGDVAGHGRDAVPVTALVRYTLRAYLEAGLAPRQALEVAGAVLANRLGQMVTVVAAVYDARSGRLTYASAGHPEPILVGRFDEPIRGSVSPPLGAGAITGLRQVTVTLPPGAAAFFHTDGLTDVKVHGGRLGRDGLAGEVLGLGPGITAEDLLDEVAARSDSQPDDMVACVLRPLDGTPDPVRERIDELQVTLADLDRHRGERFLAACRVPAGERAAALTRARVVAGRAGAALIKVRRGERLTSVSVGRPPRAVVTAASATAVGAPVPS